VPARRKAPQDNGTTRFILDADGESRRRKAPQDLTIVNARASQKRDAVLKARLVRLEARVTTLERRLRAWLGGRLT
jgi:hypothetical protein